MLNSVKRILTTGVPLYALLLMIVTGSVAWYYFGSNKTNEALPGDTNQPCVTDCQVQRVRLHNGIYTSPLLMTDLATESGRLLSLKESVSALIESAKAKKAINKVGIYIRELNSGDWISIDGGSGFHPGSLIKVPILISYLKQSEDEPSLLDKKILFRDPGIRIPEQTFEEPSKVKIGGTYSIRELLYEMTAKSDNYATTALLENINGKYFKKAFTDLGLPEPPENDMNFQITPMDYSKFFRVLYNATYLSKKNSEYALSLLTNSTFKSGIVKGLPDSLKVAHKFGEFNHGSFKELHEAGIIYLDHAPYLITIMTEGDTIGPMPDFLANVSSIINEKLSKEEQ